MTTAPTHRVRGAVFDLDGTLTVPRIDFAAIRADFTETGRNDHRCAYAVLAAGFDNPGHCRCRRGYHHQIDGLADAVEIGIGLLPLHRVVLRVDGHNRASETGFEQVPVYNAAYSVRSVAGAEKRNAALSVRALASWAYDATGALRCSVLTDCVTIEIA